MVVEMAEDNKNNSAKENLTESKWRPTGDIIQATIGDFGPWQLRISILMALLKFPIAWFQLGIVFLAPPTTFWCRQPEDFKLIMNLDEWRQHIKPFGNESNYDQENPGCQMRNVELLVDSKVQPCKWGYDFNKNQMHSTIITEWNLVCGREQLVDISQMVLMLGVLFGNILFGALADKFGRKPILVACIAAQSICGILAAWSPWLPAFLIFRFLLAVANGGTMITSFVMCMEVVGGRWRTTVPILYQIPFGIGNSVMAIVAYFFREWREFHLVLSGCSALLIVYIWFVPESPRWLLATGRKQEAAKVLQKAAKFNKIDLKLVKSTISMLQTSGKEEKPKLGSLLGTAELRKRTLLLCINWLISGITFFAFSQYIGQIGSNLFLTVSLGGLIVIPGTLSCVIIVRRFGRRMTICCANIFTAVCFLAILAVPQDIFKIIIAGLGIIGLSVSTPALYLFTGELFPTVLRNMGVGSTVMFMRIGSMVAPFLISLKKVSYVLPLSILALLAIVEALMVLPLPETHGSTLPDTLYDIQVRNSSGNTILMTDVVNGNYISVSNGTNVKDENEEK